LAEELEMRPLQARVHLGLGRLLRLTGDRDRAEDHLATALGLLQDAAMPMATLGSAEGESKSRSIQSLHPRLHCHG